MLRYTRTAPVLSGDPPHLRCHCNRPIPSASRGFFLQTANFLSFLLFILDIPIRLRQPFFFFLTILIPIVDGNRFAVIVVKPPHAYSSASPPQQHELFGPSPIAALPTPSIFLRIRQCLFNPEHPASISSFATGDIRSWVWDSWCRRVLGIAGKKAHVVWELSWIQKFGTNTIFERTPPSQNQRTNSVDNLEWERL